MCAFVVVIALRCLAVVRFVLGYVCVRVFVVCVVCGVCVVCVLCASYLCNIFLCSRCVMFRVVLCACVLLLLLAFDCVVSLGLGGIALPFVCAVLKCVCFLVVLFEWKLFVRVVDIFAFFVLLAFVVVDWLCFCLCACVVLFGLVSFCAWLCLFLCSCCVCVVFFAWCMCVICCIALRLFCVIVVLFCWFDVCVSFIVGVA